MKKPLYCLAVQGLFACRKSVSKKDGRHIGEQQMPCVHHIEERSSWNYKLNSKNICLLPVWLQLPLLPYRHSTVTAPGGNRRRRFPSSIQIPS